MYINVLFVYIYCEKYLGSIIFINYSCYLILFLILNNILFIYDSIEPSVYFGKCIAFIRDQNSQHYVILHWFDRREPATRFYVISNVPSFTLAQRIDKTISE